MYEKGFRRAETTSISTERVRAPPQTVESIIARCTIFKRIDAALKETFMQGAEIAAVHHVTGHERQQLERKR